MKKPLVPSDLLSLVGASDPQLAADGTVFFTRSHLDGKADENRRAIWRVRSDGLNCAFTAGDNDRLPRLAPDDELLAFVGERGDGARIYLIPTRGGEARALSAPYAKITALAWAPDGRRLAFVATAEHQPRTARIYHDRASGARHIRALPYKSDQDGLLDGTRRALFVIEVSGGDAQQLTLGDYDVSAPAWSPDSAAIAFAAGIDEPEWSTRTDIHVIAAGGGEIRAITHGEGPMSSPSWSHDGLQIAFFGHRHGDDAGGRFNTELQIVAAAGGPFRSLSAQLDRTVGDAIISDLRSGLTASAPAWSADDAGIIAQVSDAGACDLRVFGVTSGTIHTLAGGDRDIFAFTHRAGAIAIAYSTPAIPADIAYVDGDGREVRLTTLNATFLLDKLIVAPRRLRPVGDDGTRLDAWLLPPLPTTGSPPLVVQVHGGPHAAYGYSFFCEFQILVGTGCGVVYGNPRGGQSYGQAYANAIIGDWGGLDAADVLRILDAALEPAVFDRSRVGLAGGSYGGFMTTWLLGHSDRFAAGVSMRAVNDFVSEVGASDIGWFLEHEVNAPLRLADGGRALFDGSPMRAAPRIDVPLLIEHSERDYRCPIDQAEQLFTLLRRLGKKQVEFVRFTGDGHELSRGGKPRNRILRLRAIGNWFMRYLQPGGAANIPDEAGALFRPLPHEAEFFM